MSYTDAKANSSLDSDWSGTHYLGLGSGGVEASGNGYARAGVTFGDAASRTVATDTEASFTASGGSIVADQFAWFDASSGGSQETAWQDLDTPRVIEDGETASVAVGDADITKPSS